MPRPITNGMRVVLDAAITEPAINTIAQAIRIRFGPYRSPSLPNTGVATAAVSRVDVIAHDASEALVSSSFGNSGISGMSSVCISETLIPAAHSTAISTPGWAAETLRNGRGRSTDTTPGSITR